MKLSLNQKLQLRLDIYFGLSLSQKRKFNEKHVWHSIENVSVDEFKKITKSKKLLDMLLVLKRESIRLVA